MLENVSEAFVNQILVDKIIDKIRTMLCRRESPMSNEIVQPFNLMSNLDKKFFLLIEDKKWTERLKQINAAKDLIKKNRDLITSTGINKLIDALFKVCEVNLVKFSVTLQK